MMTITMPPMPRLPAPTPMPRRSSTFSLSRWLSSSTPTFYDAGARSSRHETGSLQREREPQRDRDHRQQRADGDLGRRRAAVAGHPNREDVGVRRRRQRRAEDEHALLEAGDAERARKAPGNRRDDRELHREPPRVRDDGPLSRLDAHGSAHRE